MNNKKLVPKTQPVTIRLPIPWVGRIDAIGAREERDRSGQIRKIIKDFLMTEDAKQ